MRMGWLVLFILLLTLPQTTVARAEVGSIQIPSPTDHAQVDASEEYPLTYEVTLGPGGDHFHVWVDDKRGSGVRTLKGVYTLPKLSPGVHVITLKVVDKDHTPTGPQKSIELIAR
jgi:hypothetical protein